MSALKKYILLFLICLIALIVGSQYFKQQLFWLQMQLGANKKATFTGYKPQSEENWIVDDIARNIGEMLAFVPGSKAPKSEDLTLITFLHGNHTYNLCLNENGKDVDQAIHLIHYVWAEENYTPWVRTLIGKWKLPKEPVPRPDNITLLDALSKSVSTTIIDESRRISSELNSAPLDAELHEEAAMVIGALAMRETAHNFSDERHLLNQMSAHLAVASALRSNGKYGINGKVATVILLTLANRQAEALEKLSQNTTPHPAWTTALKIRNTGDWRLLNDPEQGTLLEQIEYARAIASCVDTSKAAAFITTAGRKPLADWPRIILANNFSVEEGHVFSGAGIGLEVAEFAADYKAYFGQNITKEQFVEFLNTPGSNSVEVQKDGKKSLTVLGWGNIAAFHQRHLCHIITQTMYFLGVMWHVPEQAAAFKKQVDPVFSQLTLYPIVQRYFSKYTNSPIQKTPPRYIESIGDTETISAANWYFLTETSGAFSAWRVSWTPTEMPFGTAYDIEHRVDGRSTYYDIKRPEWDALESEAPYNYSVLYFYIRIKYGPKPTLQQFEEGYQSILSYHISAMEDVADSLKNDPKAYTDMMNRMCNLLPDKYFDFGDYFVEHNWDEQAAQAYQRGVDLAKNRVLMANSCQWLVNYYFDTGRKDDALIIAKEAADVYSGRGLATMASLMEKMGKWGDAEAYYKKIKERYDDGSELNEFYIRNRARNENYNAVYKREKDQFFPGGFEKIRLADLSSPPVDGVAVKSETYLTQKYHVGVGAVFVGIDGYRVHAIQQYSFLRATTGDPNITLIVWSNGKYTEVKATLPNRKFECEIDNYSIRR